MDKKDEILSTDGSENELDPGIRELANLADRMGEDSSEPKYNEAGFDSEGFHKNGTRYDDEGYGADGFDEDGVDREGFDREGFGSDERTRDGYDRDGYDEKGYDRDGYNREGRNYGGYDRDGYNREGYNWEGYNREGYNRFGRDRDRYDRDGYDKNGFNREGVHKETGTQFDEKGFDKDGYNQDGLDKHNFNRDGVHSVTGTQFDEKGFNAQGIHQNGTTEDSDGYYQDGFNIFGYDREGYDNQGNDSRGFNRDGIHRVTRTRFNTRGFDKEGYDTEGYGMLRVNGGYNREGYNRAGFDREGYDRQGLDKDGYTREYNAKFNKYNVDENGYMKNGEMDPDVEFAMSFAESGIKDQNKYAAEKGLDEKDVREKIEMARKKCPNIDEIIKNLLLTGNKMRMAAISNDCEKFIDGSLDMYEFWDKHPRLTISDTLISFIDNPEKRKVFADKTIENVAMDSDSIENNLRIFGTSKYDVSGAIKGLEDFKKMYARFGIDGSPEQIQQKRENTKKIYDIIKYFGRYKNRNMDALLGSKMSFDNGQTWIEFSGEAIGRAMDALKEDKKLVCVQSVKDYIINQAKNPK